MNENIGFKEIFYTAKTYFGLTVILIIIIIITPIVVLITLCFDNDKKLYLFLTRFFVKMFFFLNVCSLKKRVFVNNLKPLYPGEKRIYAINHASLLDGMLMFLLPGDVKFLAKDTYTKIPVFGLGISLTGNVSVKSGSEGEQLDIFLQAEEIVQKGCPLIIFPEGTRSKDSRIGRFMNGTFMIALNTKTDIVPVVFETWNTCRPEGFITRDNDFNVNVLDTIKYEEYKDLNCKEISNIVKSKIIERILQIRDEKRQKDKKYYRNEQKYIEIDNQMRKEFLLLQQKLTK